MVYDCVIIVMSLCCDVYCDGVKWWLYWDLVIVNWGCNHVVINPCSAVYDCVVIVMI